MLSSDQREVRRPDVQLYRPGQVLQKRSLKPEPELTADKKSKPVYLKSRKPDLQVYVPKANLYALRINGRRDSSKSCPILSGEEDNELPRNSGSHSLSSVKFEAAVIEKKHSIDVSSSSNLPSKSWADQVEEELCAAINLHEDNYYRNSSDGVKLEQENNLLMNASQQENSDSSQSSTSSYEVSHFEEQGPNNHSEGSFSSISHNQPILPPFTGPIVSFGSDLYNKLKVRDSIINQQVALFDQMALRSSSRKENFPQIDVPKGAFSASGTSRSHSLNSLNISRDNEEISDARGASLKCEPVMKASKKSSLKTTDNKKSDSSNYKGVISNGSTKIYNDISNSGCSRIRRPDIAVYVPKAKLNASSCMDEKFDCSSKSCLLLKEEDNKVPFKYSAFDDISRTISSEKIKTVVFEKDHSIDVLKSTNLPSTSWANKVEEFFSTVIRRNGEENSRHSSDIVKLEKGNNLVLNVTQQKEIYLAESTRNKEFVKQEASSHSGASDQSRITQNRPIVHPFTGEFVPVGSDLYNKLKAREDIIDQQLSIFDKWALKTSSREKKIAVSKGLKSSSNVSINDKQSESQRVVELHTSMGSMPPEVKNNVITLKSAKPKVSISAIAPSNQMPITSKNARNDCSALLTNCVQSFSNCQRSYGESVPNLEMTEFTESYSVPCTRIDHSFCSSRCTSYYSSLLDAKFYIPPPRPVESFYIPPPRPRSLAENYNMRSLLIT